MRDGCVAVTVVLALALPPSGSALGQHQQAAAVSRVVRFATFNVAMNRPAAGQLAAELESPNSSQARKIAEILQRVCPHVLLLNEFDYDSEGRSLARFEQNYLAVSQNGQEPLAYPFRYTGPVNTGVATRFDLDGDGRLRGPGDRFGYGRFPGQYGMVVLSMLPINASRVRTFQRFAWHDMPNSQLTALTTGADPFYTAEAARALRLSSKSHWDVPIEIGGKCVHFLVCHPTPPVFDGAEDRNGRRNHDEIRLFADYVDPQRGAYLYDDAGQRGGLTADEPFIIAGDLNSDPLDGTAVPGAIAQLLDHPRIQGRLVPTSAGGAAAAREQGGANAVQKGDPARDTSDFADETAGNLRVDYVLPSVELKVVGSGIYWPEPGTPGSELVGASDHRLVWADVAF